MGKDLEVHGSGIFWGYVSAFECGQWGKPREYLVILTGLWDFERLAESTESWRFNTKCVSWLRPQFVAFIWQDTNVACDLGQTSYLLLCFLHHFHRYFPFSCLSRTILRIPRDSSSPTKRCRVPSGFNTPFAFNCTADGTHNVQFERASTNGRYSNCRTSCCLDCLPSWATLCDCKPGEVFF